MKMHFSSACPKTPQLKRPFNLVPEDVLVERVHCPPETTLAAKILQVDGGREPRLVGLWEEILVGVLLLPFEPAIEEGRHLTVHEIPRLSPVLPVGVCEVGQGLARMPGQLAMRYLLAKAFCIHGWAGERAPDRGPTKRERLSDADNESYREQKERPIARNGEYVPCAAGL